MALLLLLIFTRVAAFSGRRCKVVVLETGDSLNRFCNKKHYGILRIHRTVYISKVIYLFGVTQFVRVSSAGVQQFVHFFLQIAHLAEMLVVLAAQIG